MRFSVHVIALAYLLVCVSSDATSTNETEAKEFLTSYNELASDVFRNYALADWAVFRRNNQTTLMLLREQIATKASFMREMRERALTFDPSGMSADTQRQLAKIKNIGVAAQSDEAKANELLDVTTEMESTVRNAQYCDRKPAFCVHNEPGVLFPFARFRKLTYTWTGWRNNTGRKIKSLFTKYVKLSNEAVRLAGFSDLGEQWLSRYETKDVRLLVRGLYEQIRPLYEQIHAHVRKALKILHKWFPPTGHIPANILGNMMADEWSHTYEGVQIFTSQKFRFELDLTNYTSGKIFDMAENYLGSLGFDYLLPSFWSRSKYYTEDHGRLADWRAYVFDMYKGRDVRMAISTKTEDKQFFDAHNKMAQIHYLVQYSKQPTIYREPANDAFLDAVGGAIELSVRNLDYLKRKNLMKRDTTDEKQLINYQLVIALEKVVLLPFAYLVDEWRWSVFNGSTTPENYNKVWWRLRCEIQGVSPPVNRLAVDFDAGAMYEIAANKPFIRHFISNILQFQILKGLCNAANFTGPLHNCNLEDSVEAGDKLWAAMKLGSSVHWKKVLRTLTGQDFIDTSPMYEYFRPLLTVLEEKNGQKKGWQPQCSRRTRVSR